VTALGWYPCSRLKLCLCVGVSVWLGWGGIGVPSAELYKSLGIKGLRMTIQPTMGP